MSDSTDGGGSRLTRRRLLAGGAVVAAGATAVAAAGSGGRTLVVGSLDGGADPYFEIPVEDGESVVLAYTHSVEKTPVRDVYVVEDDALRMVRTEFSSFGAGLPTDGVYRIEDGYAVDSDDRFTVLTVAPSDVAGHELIVGGERYDLTVASGSVAIRVEPSSFLGAARLGRNMEPYTTDRAGSGGP